MTNSTTSVNSKYRWLRLPLYMAGGAIVGFLVSSILLKAPANLDWTFSVYYNYDLLFGILGFLVLALFACNTAILVRIPTKLNPEEDLYSDADTLDSPAERSLGRAMIISNFNVILSFTWGALALSLLASTRTVTGSSEMFNLINLIVAVIAIFIIIFLQNITLKRYNNYFPDRTLDLNSSNMHQEHFDKLDEGEKWTVYRAAYRSFRNINVLLSAGMVSMVLYSILFTFAPFPIVVLSVIWIAHIGIYYREVYRKNKA
ncbi:DUF3169 family protein [Paenibacillus sp. ACRSA]|uniref:DUF3169 family protein n=1 Tax=Paenibacillus sp. ACRSA TaxID=2918211 RepID=UPI001EF48E19|nr:DUF3169 family protein [Paenibacillus sp. ACRSA]MCG7377458.1 DUF3169 family protein [Paenibacillus sp. ACRSA]